MYAFDPTPRSVEWVKQNVRTAKFVFHEVGLASTDGTASFAPPRKADHASYSGGKSSKMHDPASPLFHVSRLATIMRRLGHQQIDLLKLDIEGFEYEAIDDMVSSGLRPQALAVEFHHRMYGYSDKDTRRAVDELRRAGYVIFHVSATGREYSFWRNAK